MLAALAAMTSLAHCGGVTELVVVVDTDLAPGSEIDRIDVRVEGPGGFARDEGAPVALASALPLTLGVAAGSDPSARVVVTARASKGGADVARTTAVARMAPGESRLLHVSICRACGLTCGRDFGASLPEWTDVLPPGDECRGTFADAGGFDPDGPGGPGGGDAGGASDASGEGGAPCTASCPEGTSCTAGSSCKLDRPATCEGAIVVASKVTLRGALCGSDAPLGFGSCFDSGAVPAHVFAFDGPASEYAVSVRTVGRNVVYRQMSATSCSPTPASCNKVNNGGGGVGETVAAGMKIGIGLSPGTGCADYVLEVTPR